MIQPLPRTRNLARATALGAVALAFLLVAAAAPAIAGIRTFQSPSHNIGCVIYHDSQSGGVRCDIGEHSWQAPPKPHSCDLDYGNGLVVGDHGKGQFVCAGDTTLHQGAVLPYGDSIKYAGFKCRSNTTGMRCHNLKSRHGFSLSRERAIVF